MADSSRYSKMQYKKCGNSGLAFPRLAFGIWNNFGETVPYDKKRDLILKAFDAGINHIDSANNYGMPFGSAEDFLGKLLKNELSAHRDELVITTKAGYEMWDGPYGNWGSRKYLFASLHQSLKKLNLDYVDIFYHHRPDPDTPLEETMGVLADIVKQGKALYVGISNYNAEDTLKASRMLRSMGVPLLIHQFRYNMLDRSPEKALFSVLKNEGIGSIAFCPLEQGLLTNRYLGGIPADSRALNPDSLYFSSGDITPGVLQKVRSLNEIAEGRGQSLAQMALSWNLREGGVDSVIIGASKASQIEENAEAINKLYFSEAELAKIDAVLEGSCKD